MPAPNSYYAKDDLIRVHQPKYTIPAAGKNRKPKLEDLDRRPLLNPDIAAIKPRAPMAVINPEPTVEPRIELQEIKVGPGYYTANFDLTEARVDKGNVKYQDLTDKNGREALMDLANKEAFLGDLEPNYDFDKPNKGTFKYYEPTIVEPPNIPESKLNPEKWRFYDVNLNAVKEEAAAADFARNLIMEEYRENVENHNELIRYLQRRVKKPAVGQYDVRYDAVDPEQAGVDFDRYPERGLDPIDRVRLLPCSSLSHNRGSILQGALLDQSLDGDNLLLNPDKPGKKLAVVDFGKMVRDHRG